MKNYSKSTGVFFDNSLFVKENFYYANGMGYICNSPEFKIDRNRYFDYVFIYLISGKFIIEQYGRTIILCPGEFTLLNLFDMHKYFSDLNDPCEILWLHFGGKESNRLIASFIEKESEMPLVSINKNIYESLKKCMLISENIEKSHSFAMSNIIYEMLMTVFIILGENKEKANKSNVKNENLIQEVDKYIDKNLDKKIILSGLSSHVRISPFHFSRIFKKATGKSPMQYVLNKKIIKAKYYLAYTDMKIAEIANELGFSDQSHFSRTFYQIESMSPAKYRKCYFS